MRSKGIGGIAHSKPEARLVPPCFWFAELYFRVKLCSQAEEEPDERSGSPPENRTRPASGIGKPCGVSDLHTGISCFLSPAMAGILFPGGRCQISLHQVRIQRVLRGEPDVGRPIRCRDCSFISIGPAARCWRRGTEDTDQVKPKKNILGLFPVPRQKIA